VTLQLVARGLSEKAVIPADDIHLVMRAGKRRLVIFVCVPVDFPRPPQEFGKGHALHGAYPFPPARGTALTLLAGMVLRVLHKDPVNRAGNRHFYAAGAVGSLVILIFVPVNFPRLLDEFRKRHGQFGPYPIDGAFAAAAAQNMAVGTLGKFAVFPADDGYFFSTVGDFPHL
jgi:hypothetical protein